MGEKKTHGDQKYIEGLLENNSFIIQAIYDKFVPKVVNYIKQNSGDLDQAQDVVQDTLMAIYTQASKKKLLLTCPFDAYFFLLCKRKWLNELKKTSNKTVTITEAVLSNYDEAQELALETSILNEKEALFSEMFQKLGTACQELLQACFKTKAMDDVAQSLGVTYAYARKKKSLCMGKLTQLIKASSKFNQFNM